MEPALKYVIEQPIFRIFLSLPTTWTTTWKTCWAASFHHIYSIMLFFALVQFPKAIANWLETESYGTWAKMVIPSLKWLFFAFFPSLLFPLSFHFLPSLPSFPLFFKPQVFVIASKYNYEKRNHLMVKISLLLEHR